MTARRLRYVAALLTLACTGVYLFVYLYRWEWHRAIVAGVLFLAAEVGIVASVLLDRMRSIERRLDRLADIEAARQVEVRLHEAAPEPRVGFEWLRQEADRMSVFVPLLLGAGVVLSGLAWLVERLARATAGPALERGLALRLSPLTLPAGGLRSPAPTVPLDLPRLSHSTALKVGGVVLAAAALGLGYDSLADATQTRPDVVRPGTSSSVVLEVDNKRTRVGTMPTAANLFGACTPQLGPPFTLTGLTVAAGGRVEATISPAIGRNAERRLRGCLEDATSDTVRADVLSIRR
jgi:hypothetical protein